MSPPKPSNRPARSRFGGGTDFPHNLKKIHVVERLPKKHLWDGDQMLPRQGGRGFFKNSVDDPTQAVLP